uniref:Uncharacterized protein n=1 Tax=Leersia perrieri TaxID=77586 RepID=A0A0D9WWH8_9ORYZ
MLLKDVLYTGIASSTLLGLGNIVVRVNPRNSTTVRLPAASCASPECRPVSPPLSSAAARRPLPRHPLRQSRRSAQHRRHQPRLHLPRLRRCRVASSNVLLACRCHQSASSMDELRKTNRRPSVVKAVIQSNIFEHVDPFFLAIT